MFGLPDVRKIDGISFIKEGEFPDVNEAQAWAKQYQASGYGARVIPNASRQCYEVFASEYPSDAVPTPQKQAPPKQAPQE